MVIGGPVDGEDEDDKDVKDDKDDEKDDGDKHDVDILFSKRKDQK